MTGDQGPEHLQLSACFSRDVHVCMSVLISGLVYASCTGYYNYAIIKYLLELPKTEFEERIVSRKTKLIETI